MNRGVYISVLFEALPTNLQNGLIKPRVHDILLIKLMLMCTSFDLGPHTEVSVAMQ